jgi:hypothetical protein
MRPCLQRDYSFEGGDVSIPLRKASNLEGNTPILGLVYFL